MTSNSDSGSDELLTVHPTELKIPFDHFNEEEHYSCSIQLTNKTDRIVAYYFASAWSIHLVSPDANPYVGTILPRATCSVTLTVKLRKEAPPEDNVWIHIFASVVSYGVKAEYVTRKNIYRLITRGQLGLGICMPVVYYNYTVPAAISSSAVVPEENEKRISLIDDNNDFKSDFKRFDFTDFRFDDVLRVYPTELNIPIELNKDNYSCSIQLTNNTDRIVAYYFWSSGKHLVSPNANTYVGTILPCSTSSVTFTLKQLKEPPEEDMLYKDWIYIHAYVVNDGVKAENITRENLFGLTKGTRDNFQLCVVYYTVIAVDSCSTVPVKNEKGSLLDDDDDDLLRQSINDEVHGTTSEDKGSESSFRRQLYNEMSTIVLFSDDEINGATNGLSDSSKIGKGGYGSVYKGKLHDTKIAIKMLDPNSKQGIDEFLQEMEVLGRMRHKNLVRLIGACIKLRALVYEFLPHGSLEDCLQKNPRILTWQKRTRIVYEVCLALTFLHSIKPQHVVHGDLKPANILLDAEFISKLADFGLCRFIPEGTTTIAFLDTMPKGTLGYIDPKFMKTGILTPDCDVYSFGVTILRLLTGIDALGIVTKVRSAYKEKSLMTIVDPTAGHWPTYESELLAYFGLECCAKKKRPKIMKEIAGDLEKIVADIGG